MDGKPDYAVPSMKIALPGGDQPVNRKARNFTPKPQGIGTRTFTRAPKPTSARPQGRSNGR